MNQIAAPARLVDARGMVVDRVSGRVIFILKLKKYATF